MPVWPLISLRGQGATDADLLADYPALLGLGNEGHSLHAEAIAYFIFSHSEGEIFWLIEVADSTLRRDRGLKVPVYGRSGIAEYWFLDAQERCLYVFRQPEAGEYRMEQKLHEEDAIAPLAFPDCEMAVREFLRSRGQR